MEAVLSPSALEEFRANGYVRTGITLSPETRERLLAHFRRGDPAGAPVSTFLTHSTLPSRDHEAESVRLVSQKSQIMGSALRANVGAGVSLFIHRMFAVKSSTYRLTARAMERARCGDACNA